MVMYKCKYYKIQELVSPQTYKKFGEGAWMFFGEDELKDIDTIREVYGSPIKINDGISFTQSGLRDDDNIGTSLSAHKMGKAFDLKCIKGNHTALWGCVSKLITAGKLRVLRRLENRKSAPTWTHVDSYRTSDNKLLVFRG